MKAAADLESPKINQIPRLARFKFAADRDPTLRDVSVTTQRLNPFHALSTWRRFIATSTSSHQRHGIDSTAREPSDGSGFYIIRRTRARAPVFPHSGRS